MDTTKRVAWARAGLVAAMGLTMLGAGCKGAIVVPADATPCTTSSACGIGKVCDTTLQLCVPSSGPCSLDQPDGDCPTGLECRSGICMCVDPDTCSCGNDCPQQWCMDCTAAQDCDTQGNCVDVVPGVNDCAPSRPNGYCEASGECCEGGTTCCGADELCVGDHCVPNLQYCSPAIPNGWCEPGLACSGGRCVPPDCSADNPTGACVAGQSCQDGECKDTPCAAGVFGTCPVDQVCTTSGCEPVPCAPGHLTGTCPDGQKCSAAGACVASDGCLVDADCSSLLYCSTTQVCLTKGECASDPDCEKQAVYGTGYECVVDRCEKRTTCDSDHPCVPSEFCSTAGNCLVPGACDGDADCTTGSFCSSATHACIADGTCGGDGDCPSTQFCASTGTCLDDGKCVDTSVPSSDCPPQQTCDVTSGTPGTCTPLNSGECTSNLFVGDCALGELTCCGTGNPADCCPLGEHCSAVDNCIPAGKCVNDSDCLGGYASCVDFTCVPTKPCTDCTATERCTTVLDGNNNPVAGCVPAGNCFVDEDCAIGEHCDASYRCQPGSAKICDNELMSAGGVVAPNVLIAVDRSGSMNICGPGDPLVGMCGYAEPNPSACSYLCVGGSNPNAACISDVDCSGGVCSPLVCVGGTNDGGPCVTDAECPGGGICGERCSVFHECALVPRPAPNPPAPMCVCDTGNPALSTPPLTASRWQQAIDAIDNVTSTFNARVNFGMTMYPNPKPTDSCPVDCNWYTCANFDNLSAGAINPFPMAAATILDQLRAAAPGGSTPTAPTLRAIIEDPNHAGLAATDRANAVLLVTDGSATGDMATVKACLPAWSDLVMDGDETDVDCGGSSPPCLDLDACKTADDCVSRICRGGICRPSTCGDGVKSGDETGVDCGGSCGGCAEGSPCAVDSDCFGGVCFLLTCSAPACNDGVKNGSESDVDCGGTCAALSPAQTCDLGAGCSTGTDCTSGVCQEGTCRLASCGNGSPDAGETDTDCGGTACEPCPDGGVCLQPSDCASGICSSGFCAADACKDGIRDGSETDVDCGGSCGACAAHHSCGANTDCVGGSTAVCQDYTDRKCSSSGTACDRDAACPDGTCDGSHCVGGANDGLVCSWDVDCPVGERCTGGNDPQKQAALANVAVGRLYSDPVRIKTFVVGFNLVGTGAPQTLDCHAVYGHTARSSPDNNCAELTPQNCDTAKTGTGNCYYEASDAVSLQNVFSDIIQQVSGCSYDLSGVAIPNPNAIYVYLQDVGRTCNDPQRTPCSSTSPCAAGYYCDFARTRIDQYSSWNLAGTEAAPRLEFFGAACDTLKTGTVTPLVLLGCTPVGG